MLDLVLLALAGLSAIGGFRRGAILQAFGLFGLAVGVAIAVWAVPTATFSGTWPSGGISPTP